jgi:hypothetical protein
MTEGRKTEKSAIQAIKISIEEFWEKEKNRLFKDVKPKKKNQASPSNPAVQSFVKINAFFEEHKREPS